MNDSHRHFDDYIALFSIEDFHSWLTMESCYLQPNAIRSTSRKTLRSGVQIPTDIRFVRFVTPNGRNRAFDRHHPTTQVDRIQHARVRCDDRRGYHGNTSDETMDMAVDGSVHVASRGIPRRMGRVRIDALPCTRHPHANGKP